MKIVTQTPTFVSCQQKASILSDLKRSEKNEGGWIKRVVERKNYIETVQFYAILSTKAIIFRA